MKKIQLLLLLLVSTSTGFFAQDVDLLQDYGWREKPDYHKFNNEDEGIIGVLDKTIISFEYTEEGGLIEYFLEHQAHILNSDEKIEEYNKLYIPISSSSSELIEMKARVINKSGDIVELDDSKILTSKDEETEREYKYYAFEGIEKGSIIEYYYLLKKSPSYSGKRVMFQSDYPKYGVEFELFSPNNLIFEFKSYNNLKQIEEDTSYQEFRHWELFMDSIPVLEPEDESAYNAMRGFLIYKLDRNSYAKKYDISSYNSISKNAYNLFYAEKSKSELKAVNAEIKKNKFKTARNEESMIRDIENHLKNTYYTIDVSGSEDLVLIDKIVTNKMASYTGILRFYIALFEALDIEHQVVFTSDRFSLKFDKDFEAANFLTDYLFYFPSLKLYMSPTDIGSRLGFPPAELTNTYGLFIKEIEVNNMKTGVAKIKKIKPIAYDKSYDEILLDVKLDAEDIYSSKVTCDRATGGYYAANIQPYMNLFKEEDKKEVIDDYIKFIDPDVEIISKTVENGDSKYFGVEPFKVKSEFTIDPFVESAGENYLLKIGKFIGPQVEMYQEKKRKLPIESRYKRNYHRVITIHIPENYTVEGLDKITIKNEYKEDGDVLMSFDSHYTYKDNVLTITADEYYDVIELDASLYNTYRKVINSAADFNKLSLILKK